MMHTYVYIYIYDIYIYIYIERESERERERESERERERERKRQREREREREIHSLHSPKRIAPPTHECTFVYRHERACVYMHVCIYVFTYVCLYRNEYNFPPPPLLILWRSARAEWLEWRKGRLYGAVPSPSRAPGHEEGAF